MPLGVEYLRLRHDGACQSIYDVIDAPILAADKRAQQVQRPGVTVLDKP